MKGYCPECNKEIDETEFSQFRGMCNACFERKTLTEDISRLRNKLFRIEQKLDLFRTLDQLDNSEIIYYVHLRMLIRTLGIYDEYMLKKIFEIIRRLSKL